MKTIQLFFLPKFAWWTMIGVGSGDPYKELYCKLNSESICHFGVELDIGCSEAADGLLGTTPV